MTKGGAHNRQKSQSSFQHTKKTAVPRQPCHQLDHHAAKRTNYPLNTHKKADAICPNYRDQPLSKAACLYFTRKGEGSQPYVPRYHITSKSRMGLTYDTSVKQKTVGGGNETQADACSKHLFKTKSSDNLINFFSST